MRSRYCQGRSVTTPTDCAYKSYTHSRQPNPELEKSIGATILAVDYFDIEALTQVLEDNNVHTLISALTFRAQASAIPELQLVLAADASKATKRYVANNWGVPFKEGSAWNCNFSRI